ncbi:peptidoglycan endopeptidase [Bacillus sp. HMF5848]|uniref:C40 family peptidase n=1 Tax=Bacillus sp. HMF5848 TaxID=2495421 RepID=UPI000F7ACB70|nr:LysM peptidoglycan-binding domain-containing C40 family peptidase [Bacillus sp. HMF5848]RSK28256.1 peptidoglycan endopeptidase [Bacillus sp. HMF5848]
MKISQKVLVLFLLVLLIPNVVSAYTVQPGDTMYRIAKKHGLSYKEILQLNPSITNPSRIYVGQHIVTSRGNDYYVQPGDTLYKIAKKFGLSVKEIIAMNPRISDPNNIVVGMHIIVGHDLVDELVDYAVSLQGKTNYKLGAATSLAPWVADCSSWTQHIYGKFGIKLPRTSRLQSNMGTPVTFRNMKKGDLMFFGENGIVSHVGIYMGDGYYISNLNTERDVVIFSIYESWSYRTFLWASRVV